MHYQYFLRDYSRKLKLSLLTLIEPLIILLFIVDNAVSNEVILKFLEIF